MLHFTRPAGGRPARTAREAGPSRRVLAVPSRALAVGARAEGGLRGIGRRSVAVEAVSSAEEGRVALKASLPDVVVLDGSLLAADLDGILGALSEPGSGPRPAVVVLAPRGAGRRLARRLASRVDDVVEEGGAGTLRESVAGALRVRRLRQDLEARASEIETLKARLDALSRRMADELRLAAKVQRSLLPAPTRLPRLDVAREFIPFREIGGDYYDLVPLGGDRLGFAIGDVMGKGVPAALLAANLQAFLRAELHQGRDPVVEDLMVRMNELFLDVTPRGSFSSLFFAVFDLERGVLEFSNAGHHHPFVVRPNGAIVDLTAGGTVLGLVKDAGYERGEVAIAKGDLLVFYSDGLTDRSNGEGELFGVERLKEAAIRSRGDTARIALYTLLGDAQGWSGGAPAEDDITLIVSKVR